MSNDAEQLRLWDDSDWPSYDWKAKAAAESGAKLTDAAKPFREWQEAQKPGRLPSAPAERKNIPMATGLLDYFPDALAEVAHVSLVGNEQHNPGEPLHWARGKSNDQADCIVRHLVDRGSLDSDGVRHSAKVAWRALALLQLEIERDSV